MMTMRLLAIETSCDETACAVVEQQDSVESIRVLSEGTATSEQMHERTGGVVPEVASREQLRSILPVVNEVLREVGGADRVDGIGVTVGPGLVGSLLVGVETAKALALAWNKPLFPVNHLVGHLYANWVIESEKHLKDNTVPRFPAIGLIVSGGHTDIVLMKSHQEVAYLGGTRDDAAGECFDKSARILLGVPYPGGAAIEVAAKNHPPLKMERETKLPRPMMQSGDLEMSFSGLKTALRHATRSEKKLTGSVKNQLAWELQEAIVDVLTAKMRLAIEQHSPLSVVIGGGVIANRRLREKMTQLCHELRVTLHIPPFVYCTDNAVMIGAASLLAVQAALVARSEAEIVRVTVHPGLALS